MIQDLRNWLFLWLQNKCWQEYTWENTFEEKPNQFSDDVVKKWFEEEKLEVENKKKAKISKKQQEADAEAERQEQLETQRKQQEEAEAEGERKGEN